MTERIGSKRTGMPMKDNLVIAIDGPSASGKGTCGRYLASKLGFFHVDTGAMYRALTWYCLERGIDICDHARLLETVRSWPAELRAEDGEVSLVVSGVRLKGEIRSDAVAGSVARVSPVAAVRVWMVRTQRECLRFGSLVMDGRDVGTHVFPETPFKFFLTASDAVRAVRRRAEGSSEDTAKRDQLDLSRTVAPLEPARDAVRVDNSHDSAQATSEFMLAHVLSKRRSLGV